MKRWLLAAALLSFAPWLSVSAQPTASWSEALQALEAKLLASLSELRSLNAEVESLQQSLSEARASSETFAAKTADLEASLSRALEARRRSESTVAELRATSARLSRFLEDSEAARLRMQTDLRAAADTLNKTERTIRRQRAVLVVAGAVVAVEAIVIVALLLTCSE